MFYIDFQIVLLSSGVSRSTWEPLSPHTNTGCGMRESRPAIKATLIIKRIYAIKYIPDFNIFQHILELYVY